MGTLIIGGFDTLLGKRFDVTFKSINDVVLNVPLRECQLKRFRNVVLENVSGQVFYLGSEEKGFNIIHQNQVVEMIQIGQ